MTDFYDTLENRSPEERETETFAALENLMAKALPKLPVLAEWLGHPVAGAFSDRTALAKLPVMRKPDLMELQSANPPFGGLADPEALQGNHVFLSPGPVWEPQGFGVDPWQSARSLFAAGFRAGDIVHNAFSYHMTPGAFIIDEGARALGCLVFPAGTGNTEQQVEAAGQLKPTAYTGTPDYLKIILEKADAMGQDLSSIRRALVSGGALFPALRSYYADRGIATLQCYATADLGLIAYESVDDNGQPHPGMVLNEKLVVEIVRPGTNDPVADGEVGEVVVTTLNPAYPLIRFGTGDLSKLIPGQSPCGRTNARIAGWMGRADQRTKVKGMFVDPKQIAALVAEHSSIARARLTVTRVDDSDTMTLSIEAAEGSTPDIEAIATSLVNHTKLRGVINVVTAGSLPNDGKVVSDERNYDA